MHTPILVKVAASHLRIERISDRTGRPVSAKLFNAWAYITRAAPDDILEERDELTQTGVVQLVLPQECPHVNHILRLCPGRGEEKEREKSESRIFEFGATV